MTPRFFGGIVRWLLGGCKKKIRKTWYDMDYFWTDTLLGYLLAIVIILLMIYLL